jgi:DNA-damage-inducible protein D
MSNTFVSSPFDAIRRFDQHGNEYWSARELARILEYKEWRNFTSAIEKAKESCESSHREASDHFVGSNKMVKLGSGAQRKTQDYHLTRYACYLIIQNADPAKPIVALGQTYFAVQTRRQELADRLAKLPEGEDQQRLELREDIRKLDIQLQEAVKKAGATKPLDFAIFCNHEYKGLYGGLNAKDIHQRKGLKKSQDILDYMGSDELAYNFFRASLTKQKIDREQIQKKHRANKVHFEMGQEVRKTILRTGATLPEDLPTPRKSIQELEKERDKEIQKFLHWQQQPLLPGFEEANETYEQKDHPRY